MRFLILLPILIISLATKAQKLVLNDHLHAQYVQEVILPVSDEAYVLVKDSTAFLYNVNNVLPFKKQELNDIYILNEIEKRLYTIALVPQYVDQIDFDTEEITTLVTYVYEVYYASVDNDKIDELVKRYGYLIPKSAVSQMFKFDTFITIEDTYSTSIYQEDHASLPSHYLLIDKNNILAVDANGDLVLTEVKDNKVRRKKKWTNFNGSISLDRSLKIGDVARINFSRYEEESDNIASFWSTINLKTQTFVPVDLKKFHSNLENIQEQDAPLLNSIPFFYKAENESNIILYVLPNKNFVWLDDASYYYGSDDLSKYATMQKDGKSYSLPVHAYLFNYPSRILRAIAPQEKDKIKALAEIYVRNKYKVESERGYK